MGFAVDGPIRVLAVEKYCGKVEEGQGFAGWIGCGKVGLAVMSMGLGRDSRWDLDFFKN